jgi:hypothetical protein
LLRRSSHAWDEATDVLARGGRAAARRPGAIGGWVAVILALVGLYVILPELRRYLRMERM